MEARGSLKIRMKDLERWLGTCKQQIGGGAPDTIVFEWGAHDQIDGVMEPMVKVDAGSDGTRHWCTMIVNLALLDRSDKS